jgi:hypothetical protein
MLNCVPSTDALEVSYSIANHHVIVIALRTHQSGPVSRIRKRRNCTIRLHCPSACVMHWWFVHQNNPALNRSGPLERCVRLKHAVRRGLLQRQMLQVLLQDGAWSLPAWEYSARNVFCGTPRTSSGVKERDDKSSGIEILMADSFAKINPTDPLRLAKQAARRKRN